MKLISHRGNTDGPSESENEPTQIDFVLNSGFDVEVDIWCIENIFFLGHDGPQYQIDYSWFKSRKDSLWIHCKNLCAFEAMTKTNFNYFWHQEDDFTLTNHGYIWTYPDKKLCQKGIAVMPELANYNEAELRNCAGICTDYVFRYGRL